MKNVIKGILEKELYVDKQNKIAGVDNAVERLAMWFSGDIGLAALNLVQREGQKNTCSCCGKKMEEHPKPDYYVCTNPYCDNYIKMVK